MLGIKEFLLVDDDKIEPHNRPNQLFRNKDIGQFKVQAVSEIIEEFTEAHTHVLGTRLPNKFHGKLPYDVIISGVDSMASRKLVWESAAKLNVGCKLFIDGRIGGQEIRIITVTNPCEPEQIRQYEETITSDETAAPLVCTNQAVIDIGFLIASQIVRLVRMHFTGKTIPKELVANVENFVDVIEYER